MVDFAEAYDNAVRKSSVDFEKYFKPIDGFQTKLIYNGHCPCSLPDMGCPIVPPISLSTTFQQIIPGTGKYDYSRSGNYSREVLEQCLADLENGDACSTFSSGLAAIMTITQLLTTGDHIVSFNYIFEGTSRYFRKISSRQGIKLDFVDMRDHILFKETLKPSTKLVILETPSNPLLRIVDISAVARIAHEYNKEIIVAVDNTLMTPYFQRPLDLGADIVIHSLTKYLNGHSDVVMGCLITKARPDLSKELSFLQYAGGAVPSPFDCYLCLRGIKTLAHRMRSHMHSGLTIARLLEAHPKVQKIIHPGLESHPQHDLAIKQNHGFSGMMTVYLKCSSEKATTFASNLKYFLLAQSLGGYKSLIGIPSIMTHASITPETKMQLGISDTMLRISVGLEDPKDLALDLFNALELL